MNWLIFVAGLLNLFLGFLVWWRNKTKKLNYLFGIFTLNAALLCFFDFFFRFNPTIETVKWAFALAVMLPGFGLLWVYELLERKLSKFKIFLIISPGLCFAFLSFVDDLIIKEIDYLTILGYKGKVGALFPYYSIFIFLFSLFVVWVLYSESKKANSIRKSQLRYSLLGLICYSISGSLFSLLLPLFGVYDLTLLDAPSSLFFIGFSAYAITRYRLMDIRVVIRKGAVIFSALVILIAVSAPSVLLVGRLINYDINLFIFFIAIAIFSLCVLAFIPLKNLLEKFFNKYFFASLYTEENILRDLIRKIPEVLNIQQLIDLIVDNTQKALQIEKLSLWSVDLRKNEFIPLKLVGCKKDERLQFIKNKSLTKYLSKFPEPLVLQEIDEKIKQSIDQQEIKCLLNIKKSSNGSGLEIILPLVVKKDLIGIIFLGPKIDNAAYSNQDINVLRIISNQSAVALENASLYRETQMFGEKMKEEVRKATAKLRKMNKQLKKLDKAKSEFISIASHQLRTPITAIRGYLSMILEGDYGRLTKGPSEALRKVGKSSDRMAGLVEDLLNISRIESGRMVFTFQKSNLENFTKNIIEEFKPMVKEKGLKLKYLCFKNMPEVNIDETKIKEVVSNLIDNAIKYTEKGNVTLELKTIIENKKKYALISVSDTGMGVEKEDLSSIFQKFRRGKKVTLVHTEGLGLGMYFSRKVVEAHKGKIWVESEGTGKGSTFFVKLKI
ncbi:GAF domain-containing sensor histidine kinase [Candidatus Falkowbacteria bacterium]|jgi:signal transduction histidine kinase|nr:GAF domain-containing sensor histidine kinase [Candidatus Falkowbacteria bacterium]MBT4433193.1 GAF domain-containing sensor histidine kinase [Candidatus Falkowbacteria bacterium]